MATPRSSAQSIIPPLWIFTLAFLALFAWLVFELREIVVLLVVGYCLAYVLEPAIAALERRRLPRLWSFVLLGLIAILFVVFLVLSVVPTFVREYQELAVNFPSYLATAKERFGGLLERTLGPLPMLGERFGNLSPSELVPQVDAGTVRSALAGVAAALLRGYSITLTLLNILLLPFIVYYLSKDFRAMHVRALALFPPTARPRVVAIAREVDGYVSSFVQGQIIVCSILFGLYSVGLGILGIKLWFLLALISGFGNLIPYVGFLTGIVLSSLMALVTYGDWSHLIWTWGVYGTVQLLEGTLITPRVVGERVGLSPLAVILAVIIGGDLFGLLGVFLAVPGAATLKVLAGYLHGWTLRRLAQGG